MTCIKIDLEPNIYGDFSYYPGHILKGVVVLTTEHPKKFSGFYIEVYGKGKCQWTERKGRSSITYMGKEVYIRSRQYLLGQYGGSTFKLQAGTQKYKFSCQLPLDLPNSLDLKYGSISYHVKAVLNSPWKFDKDKEVNFSVVRHDDLNYYPELRMPMTYIVKSNMSAVQTNSILFQMSVTIPYAGFAVLHSAPIFINYENMSFDKIFQTKIKLIQVTIYHSPIQHKLKTKNSIVKEYLTEGVNSRSSKTIQTSIEIPNLMTSNEKYSQVVIIKYFIEVEAVKNGFGYNLKVAVPVIIGKLPLRFDNLMVQPTAPNAESVDSDNPPKYEELN